MNKPAILFVDNIPDFLETRSEFLRMAGFHVYPAQTMAQAEEIARDRYIQAAVIDLRLVRENDDTDVSGFTLARKPVLRSIPKIILTNDTIQSHAIEALRANRLNGPIVDDYIVKTEGPDALIAALHKILGTDSVVPSQLIFHWDENNDGLSFETLVCKIDSSIKDNRDLLPDRCQELEDLFRKVFADYAQVTITRIYWQRDNRVALGIIAFSKDHSGTFLMHCGLIDKIRQESDQYKRYLKDSPRTAASTGALVGTPIELQRFGVMLYDLMNTDIEQVRTFKEFCEQNDEKAILAAVHNLFEISLPSWREPYPGVQDHENLAYVYRKHFDLDHEKMPQARFRQNIRALLQECRARFGIETDFLLGKMIVKIPGQDRIDYPDPVKYLYDTEFWGKIDFLCQTTPVALDMDTILVDGSTQKTWLTDFAQVNKMPEGYHFAYFETQLRFFPIDFTKIPAMLAADASLFSDVEEGQPAETESTALLQTRRFNTISTVHDLATASPDFDTIIYTGGLFFCTLGALANYDQDIKLSNQAIRALLYRLLFAGLLCKEFEQRKVSQMKRIETGVLPKIRVDLSTHEVWLGDQQVDLNPSEFELMAYFYKHRGTLCLTATIMNEVYKIPAFTRLDVNNYLNSYVSRIRHKIEPDPHNPVYLITVPRKGYKLVT